MLETLYAMRWASPMSCSVRWIWLVMVETGVIPK
jgi:hypothetical protein